MALLLSKGVPHLLAELALIRALPVVLGQRVLHNVVLAQDRQAADLAVVLADGQRELRVVEDGAVEAVVQRVGEPGVAAAAVCE